MDANTEEAAGHRAAQALAGAGVVARSFVFASAERAHRGHARGRRGPLELAPGECLVAVGSGVITDIVRYAAELADRDFVTVPTAASMDGYASSVAALQLDGVKVTYPARAPVAIFADPRVAAAAPAELTRAGIGDLLGKATARVDWLAAHLLYGEPFSPAAADRVLEPLSFAAANADAVMTGDAERRAGPAERTGSVRDRDGDRRQLTTGERVRASCVAFLGPARRARTASALAARTPGRLRHAICAAAPALRLRGRRAGTRPAGPAR